MKGIYVNFIYWSKCDNFFLDVEPACNHKSIMTQWWSGFRKKNYDLKEKYATAGWCQDKVKVYFMLQPIRYFEYRVELPG